MVRNWMKFGAELNENLVRNWIILLTEFGAKLNEIWCGIEWKFGAKLNGFWCESAKWRDRHHTSICWDFLCVFVRLSPQSQCILGKKGAHPVQLFSWLPFYLLAQLESSQLSCCLHHNHRSNLKSRIAKSTGLNLDVAASLTIPLIIKVWFRIFFRFLAPILLSDKLLWIVS